MKDSGPSSRTDNPPNHKIASGYFSFIFIKPLHNPLFLQQGSERLTGVLQFLPVLFVIIVNPLIFRCGKSQFAVPGADFIGKYPSQAIAKNRFCNSFSDFMLKRRFKNCLHQFIIQKRNTGFNRKCHGITVFKVQQRLHAALHTV